MKRNEPVRLELADNFASRVGLIRRSAESVRRELRACIDGPLHAAERGRPGPQLWEGDQA